MRGSPPGDSLVPPDQGLARRTRPHTLKTARKAAGLTTAPISAEAEAEVRQPAVLDSEHGGGSPFSHSNGGHLRVIAHLAH